MDLGGGGGLGMRQRGGEGWVATVLILSKTADAAAADAAANQTHLWWYPLGYNTNPHPTFHPDCSLSSFPSRSFFVHPRPAPSLFDLVHALLLRLYTCLSLHVCVCVCRCTRAQLLRPRVHTTPPDKMLRRSFVQIFCLF